MAETSLVVWVHLEDQETKKKKVRMSPGSDVSDLERMLYADVVFARILAGRTIDCLLAGDKVWTLWYNTKSQELSGDHVLKPDVDLPEHSNSYAVRLISVAPVTSTFHCHRSNKAGDVATLQKELRELQDAFERERKDESTFLCLEYLFDRDC
jgi:hypothetical protein